MFKPLSSRALVRRLEPEQVTPGGIIIPATAQDKSVWAQVIATGRGELQKDGSYSKSELKEGDIVLLAKWSGNEIKLGGEEYLVLPEDQILGVQDPEEAEED
jgi:chaperonin GroES